MLFGMTRGEIGLVIFIFALVYVAGLLPKAARGIARRMSAGTRTR